jgi:gluconate 5-dehydrogenase
MESGVYWHALATQVVAEAMAERGGGSIINVSSMYALVSPDPMMYEGTTIFNPPTYGATKAALLSLTRYTAAFYGRRGVRCNALLPGAFPNLGGNSYNAPRNEEFLKRLSDRTLLGRYGQAQDIKGAAIFLASDAASYVTGQCLSVDGGWTVR